MKNDVKERYIYIGGCVCLLEPQGINCRFAEIGGLSLDQFGQESEVSNVLGLAL